MGPRPEGVWGGSGGLLGDSEGLGRVLGGGWRVIGGSGGGREDVGGLRVFGGVCEALGGYWGAVGAAVRPGGALRVLGGWGRHPQVLPVSPVGRVRSPPSASRPCVPRGLCQVPKSLWAGSGRREHALTPPKHSPAAPEHPHTPLKHPLVP